LGNMSKAARDNRANQLNPEHSAYIESRAATKATTDNRSDQLNPETDVYYESRGKVRQKSNEEQRSEQ
jgi:hypothetical protein